MDVWFRELFTAEEYAWYGKIIPTLDTRMMRELLEEDVKKVCESKKTRIKDFMRFKLSLLQDEEKWQQIGQIYDWSVRKPQTQMFHFNIFWDALESKPTRYYQVWMSLENVWSLCMEGQTSPMWNLIPDIPIYRGRYKPSSNYCAEDSCFDFCFVSFSYCPVHLITAREYVDTFAQDPRACSSARESEDDEQEGG